MSPSGISGLTVTFSLTAYIGFATISNSEQIPTVFGSEATPLSFVTIWFIVFLLIIFLIS